LKTQFGSLNSTVLLEKPGGWFLERKLFKIPAPLFFVFDMENSKANPQLENGYVRIANELFEAMGKYPFSGAELKILIVIIRLTYGWGLKQNVISFSKIAYLSSLDARYIKRVVKRLVQDKVLIKYKHQRNNILGVNKDYLSWRLWKTQNVSGQIDTTKMAL